MPAAIGTNERPVFSGPYFKTCWKKKVKKYHMPKNVPLMKNIMTFAVDSERDLNKPKGTSGREAMRASQNTNAQSRPPPLISQPIVVADSQACEVVLTTP